MALFDGQAQRIDGDVAGARRSWQRARAMATRLDMPYEAALADIELAASYSAGSPDRITAATRALRDLEQNGAWFDAGRARVLLDAADGSRAGSRLVSGPAATGDEAFSPAE